MSIQDFEKVLEAVETPNQADYSEDQELSCLVDSCNNKPTA